MWHLVFETAPSKRHACEGGIHGRVACSHAVSRTVENQTLKLNLNVVAHVGDDETAGIGVEPLHNCHTSALKFQALAAIYTYGFHVAAKKVVEPDELRESVAQDVMVIGGIDNEVVVLDFFIEEETVMEDCHDFIQPLRRARSIGA